MLTLWRTFCLILFTSLFFGCQFSSTNDEVAEEVSSVIAGTSKSSSSTDVTKTNEDDLPDDIKKAGRDTRVLGSVFHTELLSGVEVYMIGDGDEEKQLVATTDENGDYAFQVILKQRYPALLFVEIEEGNYLTALIPKAPENNQDNFVSINTFTHLASLNLMKADLNALIESSLQGASEVTARRRVLRKLSDISAEDYEKMGNSLTTLAFGNKLSFSEFTHVYSGEDADEDFSDAHIGSVVPVALIKTADAFDDALSLQESLAVIADTDDARLQSGLLDQAQFQANLSANLIQQGHSAGDSIAALEEALAAASEEEDAKGDTGNVQNYLTALDKIATEAGETQLTGAALESTLGAAARILGALGESSQHRSVTEHQKTTDSVVTLIKGPLVESMSKLEQAETIDAAMDGWADGITRVIDVERSILGALDAEKTLELQNQVDLTANILTSPLITIVQQPDLTSLPEHSQRIALRTIALESIDSVFDQVKRTTSVDLIAQAQLTSEVTELAGFVREGVAEVLANEEVTAAVSKIGLESLVENTAGAIRKVMAFSPDTSPKTVANISIDAAIAAAGRVGDNSGTHIKDSVVAAVASETLNKVQEQLESGTFDLTAGSPDAVGHIVTNMSGILAPVLVTQLIGEADLKGPKLEVVTKVVANSIAEQVTADLTGVLEGIDLSSAQSLAQESSETALTQTKSNIEVIEQQTSFNGLLDVLSSVEAAATSTVLGAVATSVSSIGSEHGFQNPEDYRNSLEDVIQVTSDTVEAALEQGASVEELQTIATTSAESLQSVFLLGDSIAVAESAQAVSQSVTLVAATEGVSVADIQAATKDVGDVVAALSETVEGGDHSSLLQNLEEIENFVQTTVNSGNSFDLDGLVSSVSIDSENTEAQGAFDDVIQEKISENVIPRPSELQLSAESDGGISDSDQITRSTTLLITGTVAMDGTLNLKEGEDILASAGVTAGTWEVSVTLEPGEHTLYATLTAREKESNASSSLVVSIDRTDPEITLGTVIEDSTNTVPEFSFTTSEAGSIRYQGSCESEQLEAVEGENTITLSTLELGVYNDCGFFITDAAGNFSDSVALPSFKVLSQPPVVGGEGALEASGITSSEITVTWTEATDDNDDTLEYRVYYSAINEMETYEEILTNGAAASEFQVYDTSEGPASQTITGLEAGITYYVNVLVQDDEENISVHQMLEVTTTE